MKGARVTLTGLARMMCWYRRTPKVTSQLDSKPSNAGPLLRTTIESSLQALQSLGAQLQQPVLGLPVWVDSYELDWYITEVPLQPTMFGEPLQGVKGSVRPRRAILQEAIEVQCIRWEQAVLLLHVGPQLCPRLQGVHHRRSFGLCDLPLRQSIQSILPLSVPLRGQLPLRDA